MPLNPTGIANAIRLDNGSYVLPSVGVPGTTTTEDDSGVGSIALSDNGQIYRKDTAGAGTDKWTVLASTGASSWRDPVLVKEDTVYANLAAAEATMNTGFIDGQAVSEGDQALYTEIVGENKNVFTIAGTPGAGATLVEDGNLATVNDVIRIDEGSSGLRGYYYDGTDWIDLNSGDYLSNQVVVDGSIFEDAISALDAVSNVKTDTLPVPAATPTVISSVLVDEVRRAVWEVSVYDTVSDRFEGITITALHNGRLVTDADDTDDGGIGRDRIGGVIAGLSYDVVLSGAGAAQTMDLQFTATNACDVTVMLSGYTTAS